MQKIKADNKYRKKENILGITTTDSQGNQTPLLLGTDANHTAMRDGRTLDEFAYETLDWQEFKSNGEDITVNNGKKAWVRSGKIGGQTVKNLVTTSLADVTVDNRNGGGVKLANISTGSVEKNKTYTVAFYATNIEVGTKVGANLDMGWYGAFYPSGLVSVKEGLNVFSITPTSMYENKYGLQLKTATGSFVANKGMVFEGDVTNYISSYIPFGLSSTKAIISVDGVKYPFFRLDENGNKEVIQCGNGTTVTVKDDMSGIVNDEWKEIVLDGSENWTLHLTKTNTISFYSTSVSDAKVVGDNTIATINNTLPDLTYTKYTSDCEGVSLNNSGGSLMCVSILKSKLSTQSATGFKALLKKWYDDGIPCTVRYQLATPIVTHIPKEVNQAIATNKTMIFKVDSAVNAKEFSVTVAVDRVGELEERLSAIEAINL